MYLADFSDGRGGGEWNKLSVCIPRYITASIAHKAVYKFAEDLVKNSSGERFRGLD